jgi:hypothetical protein
LKEKYKKDIEQELIKRNLVKDEKKKEDLNKPLNQTEGKTKSIKRINIGDIEPIMNLKTQKKSIRYNYKD